jgi:hypothetical protein
VSAQLHLQPQRLIGPHSHIFHSAQSAPVWSTSALVCGVCFGLGAAASGPFGHPGPSSIALPRTNANSRLSPTHQPSRSVHPRKEGRQICVRVSKKPKPPFCVIDSVCPRPSILIYSILPFHHFLAALLQPGLHRCIARSNHDNTIANSAAAVFYDVHPSSRPSPNVQ